MIRLQDITLVCYDAQLVLGAIVQGVPVDIDGHHGFIVDAQPRSAGGVTVILAHTGPQTCSCPHAVEVPE